MPKLGTIKALNKQWVITKHYGQLAEPATVRNYFDAASQMIDAALKHTVGKSLDEVFLTDLLKECEAKELLVQAIALRDCGSFLECLINIRKAFYVEYEHDFAIHRFSDLDEPPESALALIGLLGGHKAPHYKRTKAWITGNVGKPVDYVQVDYREIIVRFETMLLSGV